MQYDPVDLRKVAVRYTAAWSCQDAARVAAFFSPAARSPSTAASRGPGGAGHRVRISGFENWRIGEDGLIASWLGHFDAAEYQRQLEGGARDPAKGGIG